MTKKDEAFSKALETIQEVFPVVIREDDDEPGEGKLSREEVVLFDRAIRALGVDLASDARDLIFADIENAASLDDLLTGGSLTSPEDLGGEALKVNDWKPQIGDFGLYAVIDATSEREGAIKIGCGGTVVLRQLIVAAERGWFPFEARIEVNKTRLGYRVFRLVKA